MKKLFRLLWAFALLNATPVSAQQCLSGGCSNFGSQYPTSGAPYTPPATWQLLVNPANGNAALMNAGNYTLFNVVAGTRYEWSYCENYGGTSAGWDAQLTLFNNTNLTTPICFSTDNCGTNNLAPYISWVATFSGTVRLLTTTYNGGTCKTNSGAPYNKLVYRQVSASTHTLTIRVNDGAGTPAPGTKVILRDAANIQLSSASADASGDAVFTGLSSATYNFDVYRTPSAAGSPIAPNEEYWGSGTATVAGANAHATFGRNMPYISGTSGFIPSTLQTGQQSSTDLSVKNPNAATQSTYMRLWVDRDQAAPYDHPINSATAATTAGGTRTATFNVTSVSGGTHYYYAAVYTDLNGTPVLTDQLGWTTAFTANSANCTTPSAPATLTATPSGQITANLDWSAGSTAGTAPVTYYWVIGTTPTVTYGSGVAQGSTSAASVSVTGLNCNTTYYARVYARTSCDGTSSAYTTSGTFTTAACAVTQYGIDVSAIQGSINWSQVAAAGKTFAFIKSTKGTCYTDGYFNSNMINSRNAGLKAGVYHFALPEDNNAVTEANYFLTVTRAYIGPGFLPPVLDIEDPAGSCIINTQALSNYFTASGLAQWVRDFADVVYTQTGVMPIVYTSRCQAAYLAPYVTSGLIPCKLWIADYGNPAGAPANTTSCTWNNWPWLFHQYSSTGTVAGISGAVDLNVYRGSAAELTGLATAVRAPEAERFVRIYPNPNHGSFVLDVRTPLNNAHLRILNVTGQTVHEENINNRAPQMTKQFLLNVPPGIYFLELVNRNERIMKKILIQ
ncbi:MAG: T9SS type A sorting domain-containing protein [Chitinophagaceae bacterium]|nr:MAG: T9SS type A sorting domain-containing protein [Chitinophagaceae bacterium]